MLDAGPRIEVKSIGFDNSARKRDGSKIPTAFEFCGRCGQKLESDQPKQAEVVSDRTVVNEILLKSPEAMEVLEEHGIRELT